jgi:hypothetical protein
MTVWGGLLERDGMIEAVAGLVGGLIHEYAQVA